MSLNEFYRRPDQILVHKPENTKTSVLHSVKEASVVTMKAHKIDLEVMQKAGIAIQLAFKKYIRATPQTDEMRELTTLATSTMEEVLEANQVPNAKSVAGTFQISLQDYLPE